MDMKTVIMAGGCGTRISEYTKHLLGKELPKPMLPIDGTPLLVREICSLRDQGFKDIILTVSYLADEIINYLGDGSKLGVKIAYFVETQPLGNAGALFKIRDHLSDDFLLLNADSIFDIDFRRVVSFHREYEAMVTLFTHPNSHPYDSGLIITDDNDKVMQWLMKEESRPRYYTNRVNAGIHIINVKALNQAAELMNIVIDKIGTKNPYNGEIIKVDLDRQILKPLCSMGKVFAYDSPEYVKDMGTPERYESVNRDYKAGIVHAKNLLHRQKAIFLDRDGTINKYKGFLRDIDDFELIDGVSEAIKRINESGYLAIIVTNQPVIARGELTLEELSLIHKKLETLLGQNGAYVDSIYFCPHHTDRGFKGEIPELKIDCDCRKPKPGMLLEAARDFNIDLSSSWMVGDSRNDVMAGKNAGCKTCLLTGIGTRQNGKGTNPDYGQELQCTSLLEFVDKVFKDKKVDETIRAKA